MSIRTRLTLSFTCLFGVIVIGLAIGTYVLVRNSLFSDLNTELQVAIDGTAMSAEHELNEHDTVAGGEADLEAVLSERRNAGLPDTQILVRDGARNAAFKAGANASPDLRFIPLDRLNSRTYKTLRIAWRELPVPKFNMSYTIYAAASTASVSEKLTRLAIILALLVPLGLLLAASAGYGLAKRSLAPLNELSATIDSVTSTDLKRRVAVASEDGEIGRIGRCFNSLLDRLQQAFDAQHRFMADASHELRTPVTVALAAAQVTARDPHRTQADSDGALQMIEEQMLRLKRIVHQLLLLSQSDASSLTLKIEDVYLDDVVAEASRAAQALARVKEQRLEVQGLPEARIQGDSELLGQAVLILLDNAVKFTPRAGIIRVEISRRGSDWVCCVEDNGIGIPEAAQPHIFERFYRAERQPEAGRPSGSGLGLAIAKVIVERHEGTLALRESRAGCTRFEMSFRSAEARESDPEPSQANSFAVRM